MIVSNGFYNVRNFVVGEKVKFQWKKEYYFGNVELKLEMSEKFLMFLDELGSLKA